MLLMVGCFVFMNLCGGKKEEKDANDEDDTKVSLIADMHSKEDRSFCSTHSPT